MSSSKFNGMEIIAAFSIPDRKKNGHFVGTLIPTSQCPELNKRVLILPTRPIKQARIMSCIIKRYDPDRNFMVAIPTNKRKVVQVLSSVDLPFSIFENGMYHNGVKLGTIKSL